MQINPKTVKKQFEKNMEKYSQNAVVQARLAEKLIDILSNYQTAFDKILELGSGTGLLTKILTQKLQYEKYYANDLTEKSQNYLDKILPQYSFIEGNAQKINPNCRVDLIVSNAMFQWLKKIDENHFANMLNKEGMLAFSTFSPENFNEIREITGLSLHYKTTDEIKSELNSRFDVIHIEEYKDILHFANPLELLAHMKNTGVNSLSSKHWTFNEVKSFCERYQKKYTNIRLTYAPIICIAKLRENIKK